MSPPTITAKLAFALNNIAIGIKILNSPTKAGQTPFDFQLFSIIKEKRKNNFQFSQQKKNLKNE
jgi:hypothetical protein